MKPSRRNVVRSIALLATAWAGCGRQVIITTPRKFSFPADPKPKSIVKVPVPRVMAPSNGIDVPMIEPE